MRHTGFQVAIDAMPRDQPLDQILGVFGQLPKPAGPVTAQHGFQLMLVNALT